MSITNHYLGAIFSSSVSMHSTVYKP